MHLKLWMISIMALPLKVLIQDDTPTLCSFCLPEWATDHGGSVDREQMSVLLQAHTGANFAPQ